MAEILLRDGVPDTTYATLGGHLIQFLKMRTESNEPVVKVIETGHILVMPSDSRVVEVDTAEIPVTVEPDEIVTAEETLFFFVSRLWNDAGLTVENITDLIPLTADQVESELRILTGGARDGREVFSPIQAAKTTSLG